VNDSNKSAPHNKKTCTLFPTGDKNNHHCTSVHKDVYKPIETERVRERRKKERKKKDILMSA
jgi:hypothetical protein